MNTTGIVMFSAALLAMISAGFGVGFARLLWAEDLHRTYELKKHWDSSRESMEKTIATQRRHIETLQK